MQQRTRTREDGLTLFEVTLATAMLAVLIGSIASTSIGIQNAFLESNTVSDLNLRARHTMNRIVALASQALTSDAEFSPLNPSSGVSSHGLRFRLISAIDTSGAAVFNNAQKVYIYGPDPGTTRAEGIVVGRVPDLATLATYNGVDNILGTPDDDVSVYANGIPAVEILLSSQYAPTTGSMLTIDSSGRLLTFVIRANATGPDGGPIFPNDLVITERVALRQ